MVISKDATSSDILRWDFSVMAPRPMSSIRRTTRSAAVSPSGAASGAASRRSATSTHATPAASTLVHGPERACLVRMLFEDFATGTASISHDFSNLRLRGERLEFSMCSPFDLMVNRAGHEGWLWAQSPANLSPAQNTRLQGN